MRNLWNSNHIDNLLVKLRFSEYFKVVILWFVLRILTSLFAGCASALRPFSTAEQVQAWPPFYPLDDWLYRVMIAPWQRWDTVFFIEIVQEGYKNGEYLAQFYPLYPWLSAVPSIFGVEPLVSLVIISSLASLLLAIFFFKLSKIDFRPNIGFTSLVFFLIFPSSYIFFAPYTEALFLLLSVLTFYYMRKNEWWKSGAFAALAVLTRQQGIFLLIPFLIELWESKGRSLKTTISPKNGMFALILIPLSMFFWIFFRCTVINDFVPNINNFQSFIYSVFLSPHSNKVVEIQAFYWPWKSLSIAFQKLLSQPDLDIIINLVIALFFIFLFMLSWPKMRVSYRIYSLIIILISLSYYTGPVHPYMGLPRHMLLAFPVFVGLGERITRSEFRLVYAGIGSGGFLFLLWLHLMQAWVP